LIGRKKNHDPSLIKRNGKMDDCPQSLRVPLRKARFLVDLGGFDRSRAFKKKNVHLNLINGLNFFFNKKKIISF